MCREDKDSDNGSVVLCSMQHVLTLYRTDRSLSAQFLYDIVLALVSRSDQRLQITRADRWSQTD